MAFVVSAQLLIFRAEFYSDGHPRIVLSKALTSSYKVGRLVVQGRMLDPETQYPAYPFVRDETPGRARQGQPNRELLDIKAAADTTI